MCSPPLKSNRVKGWTTGKAKGAGLEPAPSQEPGEAPLGSCIPGKLHPWGLSRGRGTQGLIKGILHQSSSNSRKMDSVTQEAPSISGIACCSGDRAKVNILPLVPALLQTLRDPEYIIPAQTVRGISATQAVEIIIIMNFVTVMAIP